jgi:sterol desaturase/sphingolipid hydroxylase (fatty acid hydroxylase superfamily)
MDILNFGIFGAALILGITQHLFDRTSVNMALRRWWTNGLLFAVDTASVSLFAMAVGWIARSGAPPFVAITSTANLPYIAQLGILLLCHSFLQYWTHRLGHFVPLLWSWHRVHHTDTALDATTGLRHHPFEGLLNYPIFFLPLIILSPSASVMLAYILVSTFFALFTHMSPDWLPPRIDNILAKIVMTPRLHQLHHSTWQPETDTNYGNVLVIWDQLFGTYRRALPTPRHGFALGLEEVPAHKAQDPLLMIVSPFVRHDLRDNIKAGETL